MSAPDLDRRIRAALEHQAVDTGDLDTLGALRQVQSRSTRRARVRGGALGVAAAGVLAASAAVYAVLSLPEPEPPRPEPVAPPPAGTYTRTVTVGDWRGTWVITFDTGRVLGLTPPAGVPGDQAPSDGSAYRVTGSELILDAFTNGVCDQHRPSTYTWTVTGGDLILQPRDETCAPRRDVFAGLWTPAL